MSDLSYSVGLDVTELNAGVDAVEAKLKESGVRMAQEPSKYAKASASAFEEVYSAEDKLATFRERTAFDRMTNEQRVSVLQREALTLLDQIQSTEGRTAEKANLQFQYEQKKNEIFGLNKKIQEDALEVQRNQAKEQEEANKNALTFGGALDRVKQGFKEIGVSLKGAGIGVVFAALVSQGKQAIEDARKMRDEYEKTGKQIDDNTASLARFGDGIDSVKSGITKGAGALIGVFTQIGDRLGVALNEMREISAEQVKQNEASQRAADLAEARANRLKAEQHDLDRIAAARTAAIEAERKYNYEGLDDNAKMNALLKENLAIQERIKNTEAGTVAFFERKKELTENLNQIRELGVRLSQQDSEKQETVNKLLDDFFGPLDKAEEKKEEIVATTEKQAVSEAKVADEIERQAHAVAAVAEEKERMAGLGSPLGLQNLGNVSSDVLEAELKQMQREMAAIKAEYLQKGYTRDAESDNYYLASQIGSIKSELSFRDSFTSAYGRGGRTAALAQYVAQGRDALSFDTAMANMSSWSQGQDALQQGVNETNKRLGNITSMLSKSVLFGGAR